MQIWPKRWAKACLLYTSSDSLMQIGCGAFTGCHALEKLTVHMEQGKKSGVKEMLGEMWQRIDVNFLYEYEEARLVSVSYTHLPYL